MSAGWTRGCSYCEDARSELAVEGRDRSLLLILPFDLKSSMFSMF